ncbi:MAG: DUF4377 domain-containing protein [Spirochaetales bacterium]|nr:DUF4377 domain-containing protein [Spirochaetales bacterium]
MKKISIQSCTICFLLLFLSGCEAVNNSVEMIIEIHHYKAAVNVGIGPAITYIARSDYPGPPPGWYYLHDTIAGFDNIYRLGYRYRLRVRRERLPIPPEDVSMYNYELIDIITEEQTDGSSTFELLLREGCYSCFVEKEGENYSLLGLIDIICETGGLSAELEDLVTFQDCLWKKGLFKHTFSGTGVECIAIVTCGESYQPVIPE